MSNISTENTENNPVSDEETEQWAITLYEPYHVPAKPPYHLPPETKEDEDLGEEWVLTIYEPYCLPVKPFGQDNT